MHPTQGGTNIREYMTMYVNNVPQPAPSSTRGHDDDTPNTNGGTMIRACARCVAILIFLQLVTVAVGIGYPG